MQSTNNLNDLKLIIIESILNDLKSNERVAWRKGVITFYF